MHLVWRAKARRDADRIVEYIARSNPRAAARIESLIDHAVAFLLINPNIHRPGRLAGTREAIIHPNYIIVYRVQDERITIVAVLHARQQYP